MSPHCAFDKHGDEAQRAPSASTGVVDSARLFTSSLKKEAPAAGRTRQFLPPPLSSRPEPLPLANQVGAPDEK